MSPCTYPCYIPPQTPAWCTFDALTSSPGICYETLQLAQACPTMSCIHLVIVLYYLGEPEEYPSHYTHVDCSLHAGKSLCYLTCDLYCNFLVLFQATFPIHLFLPVFPVLFFYLLLAGFSAMPRILPPTSAYSNAPHHSPNTFTPRFSLSYSSTIPIIQEWWQGMGWVGSRTHFGLLIVNPRFSSR